MKKKKKMPKVVMAASVAAMGIGLFSTLGNEARATGGGTYGGVCCHWLDEPCRHPDGMTFADSKWFDGHSTCDTVHP